jgi:hypothetical protein
VTNPNERRLAEDRQSTGLEKSGPEQTTEDTAVTIDEMKWEKLGMVTLCGDPGKGRMRIMGLGFLGRQYPMERGGEVASRRAHGHNPENAGASPAPATKRSILPWVFALGLAFGVGLVLGFCAGFLGDCAGLPR